MDAWNRRNRRVLVREGEAAHSDAAGSSRARASAHWGAEVRDLRAGTDHLRADTLRNQEAEPRRAEDHRNLADPQQAVPRAACPAEEAEAVVPRESAADLQDVPSKECPGLREAAHRVAECPMRRGYAPRSFASARTVASPR